MTTAKPNGAPTNEPDEITLIDDEAAALHLDRERLPVERVTAASGISALRWGSTPEALFLHGGGLNAHTWDATLLGLGRGAIALDLPGHGHSPWREDADYRPTTIAADIAAPSSEFLSGARVPVIGQSLGGAAGIVLAAERPDLVSALVLVDVSPGLRPEDAAQVHDFLDGPPVFDSRDQIVERALAAGIGSDRAAISRGVVLNTVVRDDGTVVFRHHLASLPASTPAAAAPFADLWQPLTALTVPVLLLRGLRGFLSDAVRDEFQRRVPFAEIVDIDSGHNVQEQRPAELAAILTEFLDRSNR